MEIILRKSFVKDAKDLPAKAHKILASQVDIFKRNQSDSRLHTKKLSGRLFGFYSFRLGRDYRVIYFFENKTAVFVNIGNRKDIYE